MDLDTLHTMLLLGAGAGLVIGVFLQVLWEDRPVTYPLSHLELTGREERS
jgi:cytochrome c oxidase subunit IV